MTESSSAHRQLPKTHYRRYAVIWLLVGGIINYFDRATLSIAAPEMARDLMLTATDIGLMGTAFAWCYAMAQLPSGWIIDKFNTRLVFAGSMLLWSFATMATGLTNAFVLLVVVRGILGITEAPCWPTAAKIISVWYPKEERGVATGIFISASKWGPAIAPPVLISLMVFFGWRGLFIVSGVVGIVFAIIFYLFFKNPMQSRRLPAEELAFIKSGGGGEEQIAGSGSARVSWASLFSYRCIWGMILGYFCNIWIWNIFLVFLPSYLSKTFHVSLVQLGIYSSVPWIGGALGAILSGFASRGVIRRFGWSSLRSNKFLIGCCSVFTIITVLTLPLAETLSLTVALMTVALFFISATNSLAWTLASDIAPPSMVGSVSAIQNFGGYFGGAFSPVVAGMIVDSTGSYALAFFSGGLVVIGVAICYMWIVDKPIQAKPESNDVINSLTERGNVV